MHVLEKKGALFMLQKLSVCENKSHHSQLILLPVSKMVTLFMFPIYIEVAPCAVLSTTP
jgi:hypothetical protein